MADIILLAKVRSIFSAAANRVNLVSGEDLEVSLGKISKWLSDLKTVAFTGSYNDLSNKPTIPDISTKVSKSGDTMDGNLTFKDANSDDSGTITAEYDDYFAIEVETGKIILLSGGPTEVEGYLQLDTVNRPSTSDNDECQALGFVVSSDDSDRIGRVVKLYKSDIVTLASVIAALGYTPVNKAGDRLSNSLFFEPDTGYIAGIFGPTGIPGIFFNDSGSTMYVGRVNGGASLMTIDSTGIYIDGYKVATLNDIPSAAVSGVKGNTETDYRTGNVNITAANIGAVRYDTSSQGLTSTQKSNARTNLGLGTAATYSSSSFASSTQGGYATDFNSNFKPIFTTSGQSHASVFRGKYLGSSFTSAQKAAIADGSFDDLYVGDYWTIGGVNWRIADIDYFLNSGSTNTTAHHLVIVPDTGLGIGYMNSTNTTSGGYYSSYMKTTLLKTASLSSTDVFYKVTQAFGSSYILQHYDRLSNAVSSSTPYGPSGHASYATQIDLMCQTMVYGSPLVTSASISSDYYNSGECCKQLALFALKKELIVIKDTERRSYWLRDIRNNTNFVLAEYISMATPLGASNNAHIRPYFCLKGA